MDEGTLTVGSHACTVQDELPQGLRLDRYVAEYLRLLTRSQVKARVLSARVNGKDVKISRELRPGDFLELRWQDPGPSELIPQDLPLKILYEDARVVVVDKEQGMVVHPGAGNAAGTLANALLYRRMQRGARGSGLRPGIVHRLDKDTSGVIIAAYDDDALTFLSEQFKERRTKKTYLALAVGAPREDSGRIEQRLVRDTRDRKRFTWTESGGRTACTLYRVLRRFDGYSLLALRPLTGRTHQLRVHLRWLGCPILGDPIYTPKDKGFPKATLMLHAGRLAILLPGASDPSAFAAPLPERFKSIIGILAKRSLSSRW
jgi:23S rRNA pseudouridine1911/1915/1917 synthase